MRRDRLLARERLTVFFAASLRDPAGIRLLTMLISDGDDGDNALPYARESREADMRDVRAGLLASDLHIDALQTGPLAALYGWVIYRKSFAQSLGRDPTDLDADVLEMLSHM